jgi:hypothetical protein
MYQDLLGTLLHGIDASPSTVFRSDHLRRWPERARKIFVEAGLLVETEPAAVVLCEECERGCLKEVQYAPIEADELPRAYIYCDERDDIGLIPIALDRLRQWRASTSALARVVASLCGTRSVTREVIVGRLWWLGNLSCNGLRIDILLAIGLTWQDREAVFRNGQHLRECSIPVVLVPWRVPEESLFEQAVHVLSLSQFLSIAEQGLLFDLPGLQQAITQRAARRVVAGNVFLRDGDMRQVTYGGKSVPIKDCVGMRRIAYLLKHRDREIPAMILVACVEGEEWAMLGVGDDTIEHEVREDRLQTKASLSRQKILDSDGLRQLKAHLD